VTALSASALLVVWEEGLRRPPLERSLAILAAADGPDASEALSIGRRDAALITLREETFGGRVEAVTDCAFCGELLELSFDVAELDRGPEVSECESHSLVVDDATARFRLPTTMDLAAVTHLEDVGVAREMLFERCVLEPCAAELSGAARRAIVEQMAVLDPLASVELELRCPACEVSGRAVFDIASFVWSELDAAARRMLEDVHALASAYGWREQDILALGPERRRLYLELVG
jgi:hypothetical protein